jgi:hypothetical protein
MKKYIIFLILILYSTISIAHIDHYNKYNKIEMEIFRNEKLIGYNYYFFNKKGNETIVTNQIKFSVKLLGKIVFQIEGFGKEKYIEDQLVSYNSKTLQNKKKKFVNLVFDKQNKKFNIKGSSFNGEASIDNVIGNWWNHKILQAESQISPVSGSVKEQIVTFVGKEKLSQYGKTYEVNHFTLKSKDMTLPEEKRLNFDIWYDQKNSTIVKVSYSRIGNWEYRLKSIE